MPRRESKGSARTATRAKAKKTSGKAGWYRIGTGPDGKPVLARVDEDSVTREIMAAAHDKFALLKKAEETYGVRFDEPADVWTKAVALPAVAADLFPEPVARLAFGLPHVRDPLALGSCAMAVVGAAVGRTLRVRLNDTWVEPPTLWVALVGEPSTKKTPIVNAAAEPLYRVNASHHAKWKSDRETWRALSKDERERAPEPKMEWLWTSDSTPAAVSQMLADNRHGVTLVCGELQSLLSRMDGPQGAASERHFYLNGYSGAETSLQRIERGGHLIRHPVLPLIGACTPSTLKPIVESAADGLLARMQVIHLPRQQIVEDLLDPTDIDGWSNWVKTIIDARSVDGAGRDVPLTDDARKLYGRLRAGFMRAAQDYDEAPALVHRLGKYEGLLGRVALIYRVARLAARHVKYGGERMDYHADLSVETEDVERAAMLLDVWLAHDRALYLESLGIDGSDSERLAEHIVAWILRRGPGVGHFMKRDLTNGLDRRRWRAQDDRQQIRALQLLVDWGWLLTPPKQEDWARHYNFRGIRWVVNPLVHVKYEDRAKRYRASAAEAMTSIARAAADRRSAGAASD